MTSAGADVAIDIVIDNYNYARFLPDAISSACDQTHPAVNVIVVDDGSTDDSRKILRQQRDRVTVVLKENGGQASALNAGFERCGGDAVIFLDADDMLEPEAAARVAAAFADSEEAPARVQYRMEVVDADGRPTGDVKPYRHMSMPSGDLRQDELAYSLDLGWPPTSANAFRADALRRILPIPEDPYRILADWYLVHLTTLLGPIRSLDEVCASYRLHGSNNFEHDRSEVDLDRLRSCVSLARPTCDGLMRLAEELDLPRPSRISSVADLSNRLISLKLDPARHPLPGDRVGSLLAEAARTIPRRHDVSVVVRLMFAGWFAAMAIAPRRQARRLALLFLFPERRSSVNRLLGRLSRG